MVVKCLVGFVMWWCLNSVVDGGCLIEFGCGWLRFLLIVGVESWILFVSDWLRCLIFEC